MSTYVIDLNGDGMQDPARPYTLDEFPLDHWFDRMLSTVADSGTPMIAELGPAGHEPQLLFALDGVDADTVHAMIRWRPTGEFGYHPDAPELTGEIELDGRFIDSVQHMVAYPPAATHVTGQQVMDAVREYVGTGQRPTTLQWHEVRDDTIATW